MTFSTMNKKFIFAGAILLTVAGFFTLTAFGGKTLEQQKQEIAAAVTARLEELRAQKEEECTAKVTEDGQRRYQEFLAAQPLEPVKSSVGKATKKSKNATTVKKDPLPQTPPKQGVERPGATRKDAPATPVERPGAIQKDATTPPAPVERPGAKKKEGGGGK